MTNSMTAEGWLKKSNFSKLGENPIQASVRNKAAWKQATLFLSLGIKCYSQWFKGERNQVSYTPPRDNNRSNEELTSAIKSFCPSQIPSHFEILQLPKEITSWLTALLLKLPVSVQLREEHMRSKIGHDGGGRNTAIQLESRTVSSSKTSLENTATSSSTHLLWLSGKQGFQEHLMNNCLQAQSRIPCSMYVQPFKKMGIQTHPLTIMGSLHSFYSKNLGHSRIQKHKKAITFLVISKLIHQDSTKLERATGKLATFRISLPCVPANTSRWQTQTTKNQDPQAEEPQILLRSQNLDHNHRELEFVDCIALTFEQQKKDKKMDTVSLMASQDACLCLLRAATAIVRRIRKYLGSSQDSPISTVTVNRHLKQVTLTHMINALRDAVRAIGEVKLGIKTEDVGTHLIRLGMAMAMYLGECPVFMIMLI
jgi:hypothetical protein